MAPERGAEGGQPVEVGELPERRQPPDRDQAESDREHDREAAQ
jgi:hypothetical protein